MGPYVKWGAGLQIFLKSQMSESNTKNDIGWRGGGKEGELAHGIMISNDLSDTNYRYLKN